MEIAERIVTAVHDVMQKTGKMEDHRVYLGRTLVIALERHVKEHDFLRYSMSEPPTDGSIMHFYGWPVYEVAIDSDHFFVA